MLDEHSVRRLLALYKERHKAINDRKEYFIMMGQILAFEMVLND